MVEPDSREIGVLDFSPFIRLVWRRGPIRHRHELTLCIHENRTARNSQPVGLVRPRFDGLLRLSRNASALPLLPATAALR